MNSSFHFKFSLFWLMLKLLLALTVSFSLSPTLIPGKCRSFPDKFLEKQSLWRSSQELCQKMRGNSLEGKGKGLFNCFSFFLPLELGCGKKICDCSFIYLTVSAVLKCGWQSCSDDSTANYSNVTLVLMFSNVLHVKLILLCMI